MTFHGRPALSHSPLSPETRMRRLLTPILALGGVLFASAPLGAQENLLLPVDSIERLLRVQSFEVRAQKDSRFEGDRTQRVDLAFPDSSVMRVKWAKSAPRGAAFNNQPRYELAAYELQKLFLSEPDYVVPPTVARSVPLRWYQRTLQPDAAATFPGASSVLVVLQYWLANVTNNGVVDEMRMDIDTVYARHFGDLNILTYLIRHNDSNVGNVLMSTNPFNLRLFSVDNGVAFNNEVSDRGTYWRTLHTKRLPRGTVERLRRITREDLDRALAVVAQFEIHNQELVPVEKTAPLSAQEGVRQKGNVVQLGLEKREIDGMYSRLQNLLERIDSGVIQTF